MTIKQEDPEYGLFQQGSILRHGRDLGLGDLGLRAISRRLFIGSAAGAAGVMALGSRLGMSAAVASEPGIPTPIPHVTPGPFGQSLHFFFPGSADSTSPNVGHDPSVINNFNGFVGNADLNLTGTGTNTTTSKAGRYAFHTDMRFMKGEFVGADGENHHGAFAFI